MSCDQSRHLAKEKQMDDDKADGGGGSSTVHHRPMTNNKQFLNQFFFVFTFSNDRMEATKREMCNQDANVYAAASIEKLRLRYTNR